MVIPLETNYIYLPSVQVARLFPRSGRYRPLVLVGPPGVGRNELKRRIIALEPDRLRATVSTENQS